MASEASFHETDGSIVMGNESSVRETERSFASTEDQPDPIQLIHELQDDNVRVTFFSQLRALLIKVFHQKRRGPILLFIEVLLPLIIVIVIFIIQISTNSDKSYKGRNFVDPSIPVVRQFEYSISMCQTDGAELGFLPCLTIPECQPNCENASLNNIIAPYCPDYSKWLIPRGFCFYKDLLEVLFIRFAEGEGTYRQEILDLNTFVGMQYAARSIVGEDPSDIIENLSVLGGLRGVYLYIVPNGPDASALFTWIRSTYPAAVSIIKTADNASYVNKLIEEYDWSFPDHPIWAMIEIIDSTSYRISIPRKLSVLTNKPAVEPYDSQGVGNNGQALYFYSGFTSIQHSLNAYQLSKNDPHASPLGRLTWAPMPFPDYTNSEFYKQAGKLLPLLLVFSYLFPVSQLTRRLVNEKETQLREAMHIMGVTRSAFYISWLGFYLFIVFLGSLLVAIFASFTILTHVNFIITLCYFWFFSSSAMTMSFMLSTFFSRSQVASIVTPIIFMLTTAPAFVLNNPSSALQYGLSFLSSVTYTLGGYILFDYQAANHLKMTFPELVKNVDGYTMLSCLGFLLFDTCFYLLLGLYFDRVIPTMWGTRDHPLFFLSCFFKKKGMVRTDAYNGQDPNGVYEERPPDSATPSVRICGLHRVYKIDGHHRAVVDGLHLDMYEDEVTVLLGHNGAGKSTTINMLTGMIAMTHGDMEVYDKSLRTSISKVRSQIGFCPQHNILWSDLSCEEHLAFIARLKGYKGKALSNLVKAMLEAINLSDKAKALSSKLSGGMKRKLSVAMAFAGNSRLIFLDEPTAGMDVAARRLTWEMIRQFSKGRIILMTTHYMDEAELLGSTIAIMSDGKLKCRGSPLFLKTNLGIGYTLTLSCEPEADPSYLSEMISDHIQGSTLLSLAPGEMTMQLPMSEISHFVPMLRELEDRSNELGLRWHAISITTLEEIFLSIALDNEIDKQIDKEDQSLERTEEQGQVEKDDGDEDNQSQDEAKQCEEQPTLRLWDEENRAKGASATAQIRPLLRKRFQYARRDVRTWLLQVIIPVFGVLVVLVLAEIPFELYPSLPIESSTFETKTGNKLQTVYSCPSTVETVALPDMHMKQASATSLEGFAQVLIDQHDDHVSKRRLVAPYCHHDVFDLEFVTIQSNGSWEHSLPLGIQQLEVMRLRIALNDPTFDLHLTYKPFPFGPSGFAIFNQFYALIIALFILIPFSLIPTSFVTFIVKERSTNVKFMQFLCGLRPFMYWTTNYVFDLASLFITGILVILVFLAFQRKEYIGDFASFSATIVSIFLYFASSIACAYAVSFAFKAYNLAQNVTLLINFLLGFVLVLILYALTLFPSTKHTSDVIMYVVRLVPVCAFGDSLVSLSARGLNGKKLVKDRSPWSLDVVGTDCIYMAIEAPIFFIITLLLDRSWSIRYNETVREASETENDDDVLEEQREIEEEERDSTDLVTVRGLRKVYSGKKVAVHHLSFGVHDGEVFAFLGTNGAGKTTTIGILCGEIVPTSGTAFVAGRHVVRQRNAVRKVIGYCPQFNSLIDLLSVEEHLHFFAELRGLKRNSPVIKALLEVCELATQRKQMAKRLSGGNKRKLSVALALIGGPSVIFLDEPSAGMDPGMRRKLWNVLEQVSSGCAIILTTHHLEEVEALAQRVAIMDKGKLRCIGTPAHLKRKFGIGFEVIVQVESSAVLEETKGGLLSMMPSAELQECFGLRITLSLPREIRLSELFYLLQTHQTELHITSYSVSQTSLESVFLRVGEDN